MTAGQLDQETELLHEEVHHHPRTVHWVFGLHVDVSERSFLPRGYDPKTTLHANFGGPRTKTLVCNPKTMPACVFECPLANLIKNIRNLGQFSDGIFILVAHIESLESHVTGGETAYCTVGITVDCGTRFRNYQKNVNKRNIISLPCFMA